MSTLILVRHGQASFYDDDYDNLSELGKQQAIHLGQHWLDGNTAWDRVLVGPLNRQKQTESHVADVYRTSDRQWPDAVLLDELDEHQAPEVVRAVLDESGELPTEPATIRDHNDANFKQKYFRRFRQIAQQWVAGEVGTKDAESFEKFQARVEQFLTHVVDTAQSGERVVAFTSGGVVSMIVTLLLDIPVERLFDLNFVVRNSAITEIQFSKSRKSLVAFNSTPHLRSDDLITLV